MADIFKLLAAGKQAASSVATGVNVAAEEQNPGGLPRLGQAVFSGKAPRPAGGAGL